HVPREAAVVQRHGAAGRIEPAPEAVATWAADAAAEERGVGAVAAGAALDGVPGEGGTAHEDRAAGGVEPAAEGTSALAALVIGIPVVTPAAHRGIVPDRAARQRQGAVGVEAPAGGIAAGHQVVVDARSTSGGVVLNGHTVEGQGAQVENGP